MITGIFPTLVRKFAVLVLKFFFQLLFIFGTERQSMNGGGAEREGDTESETGSKPSARG